MLVSGIFFNLMKSQKHGTPSLSEYLTLTHFQSQRSFGSGIIYSILCTLVLTHSEVEKTKKYINANNVIELTLL